MTKTFVKLKGSRRDERDWRVKEKEFWNFLQRQPYLEDLPESDRELVYLSKVKGLNICDVARLLQMPDQTATYRVRVSYDKLRRWVALGYLDLVGILKRGLKTEIVTERSLQEVSLVIRYMSFVEVARQVNKTHQDVRKIYMKVRDEVFHNRCPESYDAQCLFMSVEN